MKDEIQKDKELQELIADCILQKRKAQHRLFKRYYSSLFGVCIRYSSCYEEAEDILNEGFLKIFSHLETYQAHGSFFGWLKRIMVNTAIDHQRKNKAVQETVQYEFVDESLTPYEENEAIGKMSGDEILKLVQELPAVSRQVFNLYVFEDFSHAEIASLLNMKEGTSHWHLNFARTKLKEKIKERQ